MILLGCCNICEGEMGLSYMLVWRSFCFVRMWVRMGKVVMESVMLRNNMKVLKLGWWREFWSLNMMKVVIVFRLNGRIMFVVDSYSVIIFDLWNKYCVNWKFMNVVMRLKIECMILVIF